MKPSDIKKVLDLAYKVTQQGGTFNPMFCGDAGVGKSKVCQQWVEEIRKTDPEFGFIDLRLAYLEAPDFIGLTKIVNTASGDRTTNILPDIWPKDPNWRGLILFEEPNKSDSGNMNALMQVLTENQIHFHKLPKLAIKAACVNPDNGNYDVSTMDAALKNRFVIFDVKYDHKDFVAFMKDRKWNKNIINFIESGHWIFKSHDELGGEGQYISPRSWGQLNDAYLAEDFEKNESLHSATCISILGKNIGTAYHKYVNELKPLVAKDFTGKHKSKSLEELKKISEGAYRADLLEITIASVVEAYGDSLDEDTLIKIALALPADLSAGMLTRAVGRYEDKFAEGTYKDKPKDIKTLLDAYPELKESYLLKLKGSLNKKA